MPRHHEDDEQQNGDTLHDDTPAHEAVGIAPGELAAPGHGKQTQEQHPSVSPMATISRVKTSLSMAGDYRAERGKGTEASRTPSYPVAQHSHDTRCKQDCRRIEGLDGKNARVPAGISGSSELPLLSGEATLPDANRAR